MEKRTGQNRERKTKSRSLKRVGIGLSRYAAAAKAHSFSRISGASGADTKKLGTNRKRFATCSGKRGMFALLKHRRRKGDDLISGHGALPYTGGSATELSATDACAIGGRAGDALDVGCPTQPVQCQYTHRPMSALGLKRTFAVQTGMSALHPKADIAGKFATLGSGYLNARRKATAAKLMTSTVRSITSIEPSPLSGEKPTCRCNCGRAPH